MQLVVADALPAHGHTIARFNQLMAEETENRTLPTPIIDAGVQALLENDQLGFYLVALVDDTVAGCLAVTYEWSDWRNGLFWWIQSVYVDRPWRGRGVFTALYAEVRQRAMASGNACGIRLYVERDNQRAQAIYTRLGMNETDYRIMEEEFSGP